MSVVIAIVLLAAAVISVYLVHHYFTDVYGPNLHLDGMPRTKY